jgi:hypothetical protein
MGGCTSQPQLLLLVPLPCRYLVQDLPCPHCLLDDHINLGCLWQQAAKAAVN